MRSRTCMARGREKATDAGEYRKPGGNQRKKTPGNTGSQRESRGKRRRGIQEAKGKAEEKDAGEYRKPKGKQRKKDAGEYRKPRGNQRKKDTRESRKPEVF